MKWKYMVTWLPGIPIAVLNGAVREYLYGKVMGELQAHQLSAFVFILLFGIYVWFIVRWLKPVNSSQALSAGLTWLVLTVLFEFVFGHYVVGHPWEKLLHDYNLMQGRLWVIVLLWIFSAPWAVYRFQRGNKPKQGG